MFPVALEISIPLGTLAAVLTALEFVLGVVSGFAARAFLHGIWLLQLHRGATEQFDTSRRERRAVRKSAFSFFLGIWVLLGVALVETGLQHGIHITQKPRSSRTCVSMRAAVNPMRVKLHIPPIRVVLERWVLQIAMKLGCESTGIATVSVGGTTDSLGRRRGMFAPVCNERRVEPQDIVSRPGLSEFEGDGLFTELGEGEGFTLFPQDRTGLGMEINRDELNGPCSKVGLSSYTTALPAQYETQFVHTMNMTQTVHERICQLHGNRRKVVVPDAITNPCVIDDEFELLDIQCLRQRVADSFLYEVKLEEMSALFVGGNHTASSYVCLHSAIRLEYVLIQASIVQRGDEESGVRFPVIIPTTVRPVGGHCERTVAPLGQAALIHTMNTEWVSDELTIVPIITRYHAYMMAISSSQLPFEKLTPPEGLKNRKSCVVRPVNSVTLVPTDWKFTLLLVGLGIVFLITIVAVVFRAWYAGEAWSVGSARWSLNKLLGDGGESKPTVRIEVVEVAPAEATPARRSAKNLRPSTLLKRVAEQPFSLQTTEGDGQIPSRLFEYRLRTGQSVASDVENDACIDEQRDPAPDDWTME